MNTFLEQYIHNGRATAANRGIEWNIELDSRGVALGDGWNLSQLSGQAPPPTFRLRVFARHSGICKQLTRAGWRAANWCSEQQPLSRGWQDLIKAVVVDQLLIRRNTPHHIFGNVLPPLTAVATCAGSHEPCDLTVDDVGLAFQTARLVQPGGKLADLVCGVIKNIFDGNHLADASPLFPSLTREKHYRGKRAAFVKSTEEIRTDLTARKHAEKLPDRRAFWELVRIVFTEKPRCFLDILRFAQIRVIMLMGFRRGETALLPLDWKRYQSHFDRRGRLAGESGGYSRSLLIRHFAEKSRIAGEDSVALFETTQYVPPMFEEVVNETIDTVARLTAPLRQTLRRQVETGRIFPQYDLKAFVPAYKLYAHLTGNPFLLEIADDEEKKVIQKYRADYDHRILDQLYQQQLARLKEPWPSRKKFNPSFYQFMNRFCAAVRDGQAVYDASLRDGSQRKWKQVHFVIGELEQFLTVERVKKLSDTTPLKLANGILPIPDLLFLMPKLASLEARDDGVCDITRYFSVGRMDGQMIGNCISRTGARTLFSEYGETEEDKQLSLNPHSLRHLLDTELFRLGIADTIITKRANRRSVAQSYEYDHRSLSEELDSIALLDSAVIPHLSQKTSTIARLIKAGKVSGPIVDNFRKIQVEEGEAAAFNFLQAEADGFHATPYGYCVNSFTVDACPKHLECFAGCRHFTATNLPEHRRNLVQIETQLKTAIKAIETRSSNSIGRENQLEHARVRLAGVQNVLAAAPGAQVFVEGPDLSLTEGRRTVLDSRE